MTNSVLPAPPTYDLSDGARRYLEREWVGHFIDGEVVAASDGATFDVFDPSSGRVVAHAAQGTPQDVDRAVLAARRAFEDRRWRGLPPAERELTLHRLAGIVRSRRDTLGDLDSLDAGIIQAYGGFIVDFAVGAVEYYAGWPTKIRGALPAVPSDVHVSLEREPVGVVACIVPWNGPTATLAGVAIALAAGNSVILKPAEQTPMTATLLAELCQEAGIPDGVVGVVHGAGEVVGAALVDHPGVQKISFTGSAETGRIIAGRAARTLKRVTMELGGKSPFIVFDDADLDAAAAGAMSAVWSNSGQVCTAGTRTLVHRSVYDEFVARVVTQSQSLQVGSAFDAGTQLGPLISQEQLERVERYVGIGVSEGAELVLGGHRLGNDGFLHEPTIFAGVDNHMRIAQEEIFGPVMSLIPFDSEAEAFQLANQVEFGLAAGVWTESLSRAHRASRALEVGTVWINTYQAVNASVPYGGVKASGYGRNLGEEALDSYLQTKSVWTSVS